MKLIRTRVAGFHATFEEWDHMGRVNTTTKNSCGKGAKPRLAVEIA